MNYLRTKKIVGGALLATIFVAITPTCAMAANAKVIRVKTETEQKLNQIAQLEGVEETISDVIVITKLCKIVVAEPKENFGYEIATHSNAIPQTGLALQEVTELATSANATKETEVVETRIATSANAVAETEHAVETQVQVQSEKALEVATPELIPLGVFKTTGYCPCRKCCGRNKTTSTGTIPQANHTIAVDPRVIPYGSIVMINGNIYVAEDCGVKKRHIDIFYPGHNIAKKHGVQYVPVFLVKM